MAAILAGCGRSSELSTAFYETEVTEALCEGAEDSIYVSVNLEYPNGGASSEVLKRMTNTILGKSVDSEEGSIEDAIQKYMDVTVTAYREANLPLYEEMRDEGEEYHGLSWEERLEGYFSGNWKNIVSYTLTDFSFTGGAHGSTGSDCINFNIKDGSLVSEEQIFKPGYEKTLSELLTSHLSDALPQQEDYDALFVKDIASNGNFRVSDEGIVYTYGEYELGPYYLGKIEVTVPWEEMEEILL